MTTRFKSHLAANFETFLRFKRSLGYRYARAEFTLREFDRFLRPDSGRHRTARLDQAILTWLASKPQRKPNSVSGDATILRQFCLYLQRRQGRSLIREPLWPRLRMESKFVPYVLSKKEILQLLDLSAQLKPGFRAALYRALLLLLYCTGLRFGEALRLRMRDVDTRSRVLFVETFKGRARWVPFHPSLAKALDKYVAARRAFASAQPEDRYFVGVNKQRLPVQTASDTLRGLFRKARLKPDRGRIGPRPYDLRHAFAVHRLTRWSRQGADLQARLPWLSAYMGHDDILGTETYLTATPELLGLAAHRFRCRYLNSRRERSK
jgi:integrase/recombinase XerD